MMVMILTCTLALHYRHINEHARIRGFAFVVTKSEVAEDGHLRRRTYTCMKGQRFKSRKEAHVLDERNRGRNGIKCSFHVNVYRSKKENVIYIVNILGKHNHALVENIELVAPKYRKLTPAMQSDVELMASCGVRAGAIIEVLEKKHDKSIHHRNVYNLIQTIRREKGKISDAGTMYLHLINKQREDPAYHVDACFEGSDNHLIALLWMSPQQIQIWAQFRDVVLMDTTCKTNRYNMILVVLLVVDNHNRSRLVATALVSNETQETFNWILNSIFRVTGNLAPALLFTDADLAMVAAVQKTWPATKHQFCLFHIRKNLEKHFLGVFKGDRWELFISSFYHVRNSRAEQLFEERWSAFQEQFSEAARYLQRQLYPTREAWALCFTHKAFNAGIQSTQRVESYNAIFKENLSRVSSLIDVERTVERFLEKESRFQRVNEVKGELPIMKNEDYYQRYFQAVDDVCQQFLTTAIVKLQRCEMNRSAHYRGSHVEINGESEQQVRFEIT